MELNAEKIKKALECCVEAETLGDCRALKCPALINDECIYIGETEEDCYKQQFADALSLIKELTEENESLTAAKQEYEQTDKRIKEIVGERDKIITGNFLVTRKAIEKQGYTVEPRTKYRVFIKRL